MSSFAGDNNVLDKYNKIWEKIKKELNIKLACLWWKIHKVKVKEFDSKIKTNILSDLLPKENVYHACIACITIDCVMRMDKKS